MRRDREASTTAPPAEPEATAGARSDRIVRTVVWAVWAAMVGVAVGCLVRYGRSMPVTEDWLFVPALTGNEPSLGRWLWAQNNEHRVPLPKLVLLAALRLARGDFRAGMALDITAVAALSYAMIRVARAIRGRASLADAFFPVAFLHLGNWENLFWSWEFTFVLSVASVCTILLAVVADPTLSRRASVIAAGLALVALPLCGGTGLLFVPVLTLWLGCAGARVLLSPETPEDRLWAGTFLLCACATTIAIVGAYFSGYQRPAWTPANPGLRATVRAALEFQALALGPVARSGWRASIAVALGVLAAGAAVTALGVLRHRGDERRRALGLLAVFAAMAGFAGLIGWGRAGVIAVYGTWPIRYVLLAVPAFCTAFFAWELYAPQRLRRLLPGCLCAIACLLIPANTRHGLWWRNWYVRRVAVVERDLQAGAPLSRLAARYRKFLFHSRPPGELALYMWMLHDDGIGPFAHLSDEALAERRVVHGLRYRMPVAGEVALAWGVNGWMVAPATMRPAGTVVQWGTMQTPMAHDADGFTLDLTVPRGTTIDYRFVTTRRCDGARLELWEGDGEKDHHATVVADAVVERDATPQTVAAAGPCPCCRPAEPDSLASRALATEQPPYPRPR